MPTRNQGFTIIELLVVMGVFAILASLSTLNLSKAQHGSSLNATVTTLISDLKRQQHKAMIGDTEGRGVASDYGIHFENKSYTLFHDLYNSTDTSNFVVNLDGTLSFPDSGYVIFAKGSGEILPASLSTLIISDTVTSQSKTLTINQYGVVTAVN
ncbi:MAG: type II secretion system protein [Candidatus Shapirobacteria bacterium]|nr:type II secretion system protein [Candidatus Shapirobacteria bacterium]